jgi:apolipoprotein N-acyltransferase
MNSNPPRLKRKLPSISWKAMRVLLAPISSALLLTTAYPKFNLWWMAWVALIPLYLILSQTQNAKTRALHGFLFGLTLFLAGMYWMWSSIHPLVWLALAIFQGCWFAVFGAVFRVKSPQSPLNPIFFAALWVIFEWLRHLGWIGFPWFILATSQAKPEILNLLQIVSITGAWGLSFAITLVNALFGIAVLRFRHNTGHTLTPVALAGVIVFALYMLGYFRASYRQRGSTRIMIVQGDPDNISLISLTDEAIAASRETLPDLVLWTETAISPPQQPLGAPPIEEQREEAYIGEQVRRWKVPLFSGVWRPRKEYWRNSVASFDKNGQVMGHYDKQKPVPFGEFLPGRPLLDVIYNNFPVSPNSCKPGESGKVFTVNSIKYGTLICYESAFGSLWRDEVLHGAQVMTDYLRHVFRRDSGARSAL